MRRAYNITLILSEGLYLEDFQEILSRTLADSKIVYTKSYWNPSLDHTEQEKQIEVNKWHLESIAGENLILEFKKK